MTTSQTGLKEPWKMKAQKFVLLLSANRNCSSHSIEKWKCLQFLVHYFPPFHINFPMIFKKLSFMKTIPKVLRRWSKEFIFFSYLKSGNHAKFPSFQYHDNVWHYQKKCLALSSKDSNFGKCYHLQTITFSGPKLGITQFEQSTSLYISSKGASLLHLTLQLWPFSSKFDVALIS